jgi:flagellar basal body-associated protein FliL
MMHVNYTPLHLPHHLEPKHPKKISPVWFVLIILLVLLQGAFIYMFFSGRIGGTGQNTTQETVTPTAPVATSTPDEGMTTSTESATPSSPNEVEAEIEQLETELQTTPVLTPAPDIPLDL